MSQAKGQLTIGTVTNGADGKDAYSVMIDHESHAVACDPDGEPLPGELGSGGKAVFTVDVFKGSSKLILHYSEGNMFPSEGLCYWEILSTSAPRIQAVPLNHTQFYLTEFSVNSGTVTLRFYPESQNTYIDKIITLVKQIPGMVGPQGETGSAGPMLRPRGEWKARTSYVKDSRYVDTVTYGGNTYLCSRTHTSGTAWSSSGWTAFNEFINIATQVILANKGTIDVLGAGRMFVGDVNKSNGWEFTNGKIRHTQSGLELTADGKLKDPDGLEFSVGGIAGVAQQNVKIDSRNLILNSVLKYAVHGSEYPWERLPLSTDLLEVGETYVLSCKDFTAYGDSHLMLTDYNFNDAQHIELNQPFVLAAKKRYFALCNNGFANSATILSHVQLEKGTIPTSWKEAPEDTEKREYVLSGMQYGKMLYRDAMFEDGYNATSRYVGAYISKFAVEVVPDCPNPTKRCLVIKSTNGEYGSPFGSVGGFYFEQNLSRANAVFAVRLVAKIPVGFRIEGYHNAHGDNPTEEWITSKEGTGDWQEYIYLVKCGSTGEFSTINHFALLASYDVSSPVFPVTWYVSYATVYDITAVDRVATKDELLDTGINIKDRQIVLTADQTLIRDNEGNILFKLLNSDGTVNKAILDIAGVIRSEGLNINDKFMIDEEGNAVVYGFFNRSLKMINYDDVNFVLSSFLFSKIYSDSYLPASEFAINTANSSQFQISDFYPNNLDNPTESTIAIRLPDALDIKFIGQELTIIYKINVRSRVYGADVFIFCKDYMYSDAIVSAPSSPVYERNISNIKFNTINIKPHSNVENNTLIQLKFIGMNTGNGLVWVLENYQYLSNLLDFKKDNIMLR